MKSKGISKDDKLSVKSGDFPTEGDMRHLSERKESLNILNGKMFRKQENENKMKFILDHSDIDSSLLGMSHALSDSNGYHNFGHQLGVAESAIKFAEAEGLSRKEINLLVVAALFHDAGHTGIATPDDELIAAELAIKSLPSELCEKLGFTHEQLKNLILATTFSQRGKSLWNLARIIQDADIAGGSFGPYYRLYADMGLVDELDTDYQTFIYKEQQKFLDYLKSISSDFFVSEGGKKIGINPQKSLDTLLSRPKEVIAYAYKVRQEDITFADFKEHIDQIISNEGLVTSD